VSNLERPPDQLDIEGCRVNVRQWYRQTVEVLKAVGFSFALLAEDGCGLLSDEEISDRTVLPIELFEPGFA